MAVLNAAGTVLSDSNILNSLVMNGATSFTQLFNNHIGHGSFGDVFCGAFRMSGITNKRLVDEHLVWFLQGNGA
jgi:hypothetical protein